MFAVIKTGGRQYRVVPDDVLEVGKIAGDVGTIVQLGEVLVVGGDTPVLGLPTVAGASVAAEVLDHKRGPKVIAFKKRRRKNSRRKRGYRDEITVLRITEILTDNAKPSIGPRPKREKVAAPAPEGDGDEAPKKKAPAKKAVAKKAAAKKAVAKRAPAKKAAAKK
jgi:large subunit ribosomal protein L21